MKEVIAVVRINKMNITKQSLSDAGIDSFFAHEAQGRGKGFINSDILAGAEAGFEEAAALLGEKGKLYPKRLITVVTQDDKVATVVDTIVKSNQTGKPGDGKIFVLPVPDAVRVRTGDTGEKAI